MCFETIFLVNHLGLIQVFFIPEETILLEMEEKKSLLVIKMFIYKSGKCKSNTVASGSFST